tara:strand:- start:975 stop:1355 length:381 start_codon:yes stop_codon:yes gene_type:complete
MAYNAKEVWVPVDRAEHNGVANNATTTVAPIKAGLGSVSRGLIHGCQLTVSASSGASHKATVKVYSGTTTTYLHYEVTLDLNPNTQSSDTLATPIPFFEGASYTITDVAGGGSKNYTIVFYVKGMA